MRADQHHCRHNLKRRLLEDPGTVDDSVHRVRVVNRTRDSVVPINRWSGRKVLRGSL